MSDPLSLVQSAYACFGRGDIPALLQLVDAQVDWQFCGDTRAPYTGRVRGPAQLAEWFAAVATADDIQQFEPREFIVGPDSVTVLGRERCVARPGGGSFDSEWVHVWQVGQGRIQRFWGMLDTELAARARAGA